MTYPCKRRFDIRSMGQWLYKNAGRPSSSNSRQWRETSNFVLCVVAKVIPCEGYATENGWLIDIYGASGETVSDAFVSVDIASSNLALRKHLMKAFAGCICQLMSIDFLDFVAADNPTRVVYNVNGIGKITSGRENVWLFPNIKISNTSGFDVIFSDTALKYRSIPTLPTPHVRPQKDFHKILSHLSMSIRKVYPHSYMHVVHLQTNCVPRSCQQQGHTSPLKTLIQVCKWRPGGPSLHVFLSFLIFLSFFHLSNQFNVLSLSTSPLMTKCSIVLRTCVAGRSCVPIGRPVVGLLIFWVNHFCIAAFSYILPSSAKTGSTGSSCVMGQRYSSANTPNMCFCRFLTLRAASISVVVAIAFVRRVLSSSLLPRVDI